MNRWQFRPSPKDFPFNYVVKYFAESWDCSNFFDVMRILSERFPDRLLSDSWQDSTEHTLPGVPSERFKVAWDPNDLELFKAMEPILHTDSWPDGADMLIEASELVVDQVLVIREREAYEKALNEYFAERWKNSVHEENGESDDEHGCDDDSGLDCCDGCGSVLSEGKGGYFYCDDCGLRFSEQEIRNT